MTDIHFKLQAELLMECVARSALAATLFGLGLRSDALDASLDDPAMTKQGSWPRAILHGPTRDLSSSRLEAVHCGTDSGVQTAWSICVVD